MNRSIFFLLPALLAAILPAMGQSKAHSLEERRKDGEKHFNDGNWKEALAAFRELVKSPDNADQPLADDFSKVTACMQRLNQWKQWDSAVEDAVAAHPNDWRLLAAAAEAYGTTPHFGTMQENAFQRGQYGGGRMVSSVDRDRVRSLQLFDQARRVITGEPDKSAVAQFYQKFQAQVISRESWELQVLTDLTKLPDYDEGNFNYGHRRGRGPLGGSLGRGAPVDEKGDPVFFRTPESWEAAKSDGERWRWLLKLWADCSPTAAADSDLTLAGFLKAQFDVHTMARWWRPQNEEGEERRQSALLDIHTLAEDETTAYLATGVKRFKLPEEFNFLAIFKRVAEKVKESDRAYAAYSALADCFTNRRQLPRAAEMWEKALAVANDKSGAQNALDQIRKNWGRFDASLVQSSGQGAKVGFLFRNAKKATFTARKIRFAQLLDDVKKYIASNPESLDWQKIAIQQIGWQILEKDFAKYIGEQVANWDLALEPRPNHWDRRIDVTTPLQTAGAYFLEAQIEGGNKMGIVVWLSDTAIVKKAGSNESQYYVVDAATGAPVSKATLEFFGYRQESLPDRQQKGRRQTQIHTRRFAEFTDENGQFFAKPGTVGQDHQWLITATTAEGRFAHLGWTNVWYQPQDPDFFEQVKTFTITDRPVYRPGQALKFKAWVRRAKYDAPLDKSDFAQQKWTVQILDPKGEKYWERVLTSDAFGGLQDEITLKDDATLGSYQFHIFRKPDEWFEQSGSFRVEEYKKPEFEVKVDAPVEPVALGEKLTAKVTATYYFGAPVVNAKVKYKVQRSAHNARWYPVRSWDWFYGPGYWWFGYDYAWYPGFYRWGCLAPVPWWWGQAADPPELVAANEAPIGPDGTAQIEINTALAKELHADEDHRYEITVEVTDESRRTILGSGEVLVSRQPFKVHVWPDRGHYEVGQPMEIGVKAQTLDRKGVPGAGKLSLLKLTYTDKGEPQEQEVAAQDFKTDGEGAAMVKLSASAAGQYRVAVKVTDARNRTTEGGYVVVVRGQGFDGRDFHFNNLELVVDKAEYAPGDELKLLVNAERADSTVFLFVRSSQGQAGHPKILRLKGKSTSESVKVVLDDMPNFFIEAFTVSNGQVHSAAREIVVPPAKRVLHLEVLADSSKHKPRERAKVKLRLTDLEGKPFTGSTVVTVYDKSLEYISGGSNVPDIKEFFWKWRRHFSSQLEHNLDDQFPGMNIPRDAPGLNDLGVFGRQTADLDGAQQFGGKKSGVATRGRLDGRRTLAGAEMQSASAADGLPAAPMAALADPFASAPAKSANGHASSGEAAAVPQVMVRSEFADAVFWAGSLETNAAGEAEVEVPMPDNLTTWKVKSWGMGHGTRVGTGETEIITSKDLILRQQAPRFFVEKDEVVLSANVHNYLPDKKEVTVSLEFDGGCLEPLANQEAVRKITLESTGEQRVDWRVKAVREGTAVVRMKAVTDVDSDAMQVSYPVYVHGMLKTDSFSGAIRPESSSGKVEIAIPNERRPEQSRLEVRYSPSIATAIVDALPYLADYPYGCTEQTLNRFLPAVLAHKTLVDMGIDLAAVQKKITNLNPQEIGDAKERAAQWRKERDPRKHPVFNAEEYQRIVKQGLEKLTAMQNGDGGWGWFSGEQEQSYPHTTVVVVHGLLAARGADLAMVPGVVERGLEWLKAYEKGEVQKIKNGPTKKEPRKHAADHLDALVHFVLTEGDVVNGEMREFLYRDRNDLSVYAKCAFGLALDIQGQKDKRDMLLQNIEQFLVMDAENQSARLDLRNGSFWWWWYGSDIEANALYLKLLSRVAPTSEKASGVVKFLLNNRKNSTWWNSTRDTAYCVEALNDYLRASKEMEPDLAVQVLLDGQMKKEVKITKENLFSYDSALILTGDAVPAGKHTVEIRKTGKGPVYFNAYATNFTLEDRISKAGLEVKIERRYWKLVEKKDAKALVSGSRGQAVDQKMLKYDRQPIQDGEDLKSGQLLEVELLVESKNDYEYLLFEDMKPAGFEADDVRSGYDYSSRLSLYREFRDERVALFCRALPLGRHSFTYRLRAEIPGKFSALPAKVSAMYAPELRGNSDEAKLGIID